MWTITFHFLARPDCDRNDLENYRTIVRRLKRGDVARMLALCMRNRHEQHGTYLSHTVTQGRPRRRKEPSR